MALGAAPTPDAPPTAPQMTAKLPTGCDIDSTVARRNGHVTRIFERPSEIENGTPECENSSAGCTPSSTLSISGDTSRRCRVFVTLMRISDSRDIVLVVDPLRNIEVVDPMLSKRPG